MKKFYMEVKRRPRTLHFMPVDEAGMHRHEDCPCIPVADPDCPTIFYHNKLNHADKTNRSESDPQD